MGTFVVEAFKEGGVQERMIEPLKGCTALKVGKRRFA